MKIPKVFHRVWISNNPMPAEMVYFGQTWLNHHPDWKMIHWTDWNLFEPTNRVQYEQATIPAMKCDILCVDILYQFGGIYLDCDFECYRNIEPLIEDETAFSASEDGILISGGIMGATQGHPAFKAVVDAIPESIRRGAGVGINGVTGPGFRTPILAQYGDVKVYPRELFYPYGYWEKHRRGESFPEAYAAHHWFHSWAGATA